MTEMGDYILNDEIDERVKKLRKKKRNQSDLSYLEVAVYAKDSSLVDLLLDHPPDPYWGTSMMDRNILLIQLIRNIKRDPLGFEYVEKLVNNHALDVEIGKEDGNGRTAFNEAITFDNKAIAELLLAKGANVNYLQDKGGLSPLMESIFDKPREKLSKSMTYLLSRYHADITYKASSWNGMSVLDACTRTNRVDILKYVIAEEPNDIATFKKALSVAYSLSGVPSSLQNELRPKVDPLNISPAVVPLLNAILNAEDRLKYANENRLGYTYF